MEKPRFRWAGRAAMVVLLIGALLVVFECPPFFLQTVAPPVFTPPGGSYDTPQTIVIASATNGAAIRYTLDGTAPSEMQGNVYLRPIVLSASATIRAIGYMTGWANSPIASAAYTIGKQTAPPVFSPPAGAYASAQSVTISTATAGASIRYTADGSTPSSTAGTPYAGPVAVAATTTLMAIAYKTGLTPSAVASAAYTIGGGGQVASPTFAPAAGGYTTAQSVAISTTTAGASIRYTTNGSTPSSTVGTLYAGPVAVSATTTIMAIAYETGLTSSSVASATFTIGNAANGATLYATYCASCHNPLASTTKPGRTPAQISAAIAGVSSMQNLSFLTSTQILDISTALGG